MAGCIRLEGYKYEVSTRPLPDTGRAQRARPSEKIEKEKERKISIILQAERFTGRNMYHDI